MITRRHKKEITTELKGAKEEVYIFAQSRDTHEAYYQYWRGVRNALLWVSYPGMLTPIRSDETWEINKEGN